MIPNQKRDLHIIEFQSEEEMQHRAQQEILNILNDKTYLNPDKFQQLIDIYKKKQLELNNQISLSIETQTNSVNNTKNLLQDCQSNCEKIQNGIQQLNDLWEDDSDFHEEMQLYEQLSTYKKNIYQFIDELKYFLDVNYQIQRMEQKFEEQDYEYIFFKLLALTQLRDNVLAKMKDNSQDLLQIKKEFEELYQFENQFYSVLYEKVGNCIVLSRENPEQLMEIVKIFRNGDKQLIQQGKQPIFKNKLIKAIQQFIDTRFQDNLKGITQTQAILDKSKFIVFDLKEVSENVVNKFPQEYDIFDIFEKQYKHNIEKTMIPIIEQEVEQKKEYGSLINLLNWIDQFENTLHRAGRQEVEYKILKDKIQKYMMPFMNHLKSLFVQYAERAIEMDKQDVYSYESLKALLKKQENIESMFPEDIFKFINDQVALIYQALKNDNFSIYIEVILDSLGKLLSFEVDFIEKVIDNNIDQLGNDENVLYDLSLKLCLFINNFQKCMKYTLDTKNATLQITKKDLHESINNSFKNLNIQFKSLINRLYIQLERVGMTEILQDYIPVLFQQEWVHINIMSRIMDSISVFFEILDTALTIDSHKWHMQKQCLSQIVNIYFEQMILAYKNNSKNVAQSYSPKYSHLIKGKQDQEQNDQKEKKEKKKKKKDKKKDQEEDDKLDQKNILINKELMIKNLERDQKSFMKECEENYVENIGKSLVQFKMKFQSVFDMATKPKISLENQLIPCIKAFQLDSQFIFQIAVSEIRDDCDSEYVRSLIDRIINIQHNYIEQIQK